MQTPEIPFGKLVGVVEVAVGDHVFKVPIEAVTFFADSDAGESAGGFFDDGKGHLGILVSSDATPGERDALIKKATADAVGHLSRSVSRGKLN